MDTVTLNITSPPNVVTLNVISGASYVTNSNGSINYIVGSGETLVLPDIKFTDSDGTVYYYPACTDIIATPCTGGTDIMDMITMNTGALMADTQITINHNLQTLYGATDLDYRLYDLNGQERFFNELYPDPSSPLNKLLLTVGDNNPSGLLLKIIYKK